MSLAAAYRYALDALAGDDLREVSPTESGDEHYAVARGDTLLDDGEASKLASPLDGVSDERWTQFVHANVVAKPEEVSLSNGVGMFAMMPRRLGDLGLVERLARKKAPSGRTVWVAVFVRPMTSDKFLTDPQLQLDAFCKSMRDYDDQMTTGKIAREPGMSRSGALAILHRAGPSGLENWAKGERFEGTCRQYDRTAGIF